MTENEKNMLKDIFENSPDEFCNYCKYSDECHGITCYGNGPVYPPCADEEWYVLVDLELTYNLIKDIQNERDDGWSWD